MMARNQNTRRWMIGLAAIASCGTLVHADTFHWASATGGTWTDATKWTPSGVPGAVSPVGSPPTANGDVAVFDATGPAYSVTSDARNVHELDLNSANLSLNFPADTGLRTDRLVYTTSGPLNVTINDNGQVAIGTGGAAATGSVYVQSAGSLTFLTNEVPGNMAVTLGSSPETASTPVVLTLPNGPLNTAGIPATGARVSSYAGQDVTVDATNNLPAGIDVGGGALYVPTSGGLFFRGPALASPDYIAGSLYLRGEARFIVNTLVQQGVFMQGGELDIDPGNALSTPTLHWGQSGDSPATTTGVISGVVTLTQPSQPAELEFGTAQFDGTLNGDLHIHSAATLRANLNGSMEAHINGTLSADANSFIEISILNAAQHTRVVANQFVGSTTLRLPDVNGRAPLPGFYRGVLEMTDGNLPAGFVAGIQFNTKWAGLTATSQIDADDAGLLDLTLTGVPGDANLDGFVNFNDLVTVAMEYGNTGTNWEQGDFNGDGVTNFADLVPLAQRYGQHVGNLDGLPASFVTDWALAQSLAPEPTVALGLASGVLLVRRRARRVVLS